MREVMSPVDATSVVLLVLVLSEPVAPVVLVEPVLAPTVPLALVLLCAVSDEATELLFCVLVSVEPVELVEPVLELDGVLLVEPFAATEPLAPMPAPLAEREVSVEVELLGEDEDEVELLLGEVLATLPLVSEEDDLVASLFVESVAELEVSVLLLPLEASEPLVLEPVVSVAAVVLEL